MAAGPGQCLWGELEGRSGGNQGWSAPEGCGLEAEGQRARGRREAPPAGGEPRVRGGALSPREEVLREAAGEARPWGECLSRYMPHCRSFTVQLETLRLRLLHRIHPPPPSPAWCGSVD